MDISKRNFIARVTCWAVAIPLGSLLVRGLAFGQGQKNQAPPQIPGQNPDGTLPNTATSTVGLDPKEMLKHHQQQIHDDVEKLYDCLLYTSVGRNGAGIAGIRMRCANREHNWTEVQVRGSGDAFQKALAKMCIRDRSD